MIKVYFDASVIISALLSSTGGSAKLIKFTKLQAIAGITSQTIIGEIENRSRKINRDLKEIRQFIKNSSLVVRKGITPAENNIYEFLVDKADAHVIAGAKLTKCDFLVTLDKKHLLNEDVKQKFLPLKIVSPKELLEEIVKD